MTNPEVATAAIFLLNERRVEHDRHANRAKIATVFVQSSPITDAAPEITRIAENALRDSLIFEALHHQREYERFGSAIDEIRAIEAGDQ